ncbi:tocopherol cyclase family protein [Alkaliphilus crotonatoxidans]
MLKAMLQPNLYHGRTPWNQFEGWYFKLVNQNATEALSLIPGIFHDKDPKEAHCFLQILEGSRGSYTYHRFPILDFVPQQKPFQVKIKENSFSLRGIKLQLDTPEQCIKGMISFTGLKQWPCKFLSPGSMGYFNLIPFLQCYSQVCAIDMTLMGNITIDDRVYCLDGGKGYIEKNWGNAFPYSWIWIQSNHFSNSDAALSCSIGHIPLWFTSFRGFLVGLSFNQTFYEFTTMNRSVMKIIPHGEDVEIYLRSKSHILRIITKTLKDSFILCRGPRNGKMIPLVQESLLGRVFLELTEVDTGKVLMSDWGLASGVEYGGEQMRILD